MNGSASTCGMNQIFHSQLGPDNTRLMGITESAGILSATNNNSDANSSTCRDGVFCGAGELDFSKNTSIGLKGSSELTGTSPGWLLVLKKDGSICPVVILKAFNKFI